MPEDDEAPAEVPRESIRTIDEIRALRLERGVSLTLLLLSGISSVSDDHMNHPLRKMLEAELSFLKILRMVVEIQGFSQIYTER